MTGLREMVHPDHAARNLKKTTKGWTWVIGSPKWHYVKNKESLCGKWLMLGNPTLEKGDDIDLEMKCKACVKILEKIEFYTKHPYETWQGHGRYFRERYMI
jgi:hypothetical protein